MASDYSNIESKTERAIVACILARAVTYPQVGTRDDVFPFEWDAVKTYPNTTVAVISGASDISKGGTDDLTIHVTVKGSSAIVPGNNNPGFNRVNFDARYGATRAALVETNDGGQTLNLTAENITAAGRALAVAIDQTPQAVQFAANNADMADFICNQWLTAGSGLAVADEEGCSWARVLIFKGQFSPSNTD